MTRLAQIALIICALLKLPTGECRGFLAKTYRAIEGHALLGHAFLDVPGISAVKCLALCLSQRGRCRSINYDRVNAVCQMNDATKEEFLTELQPSLNFAFFGNPEPCSQVKPTKYCWSALSLFLPQKVARLIDFGIDTELLLIY